MEESLKVNKSTLFLTGLYLLEDEQVNVLLTRYKPLKIAAVGFEMRSKPQLASRDRRVTATLY